MRRVILLALIALSVCACSSPRSREPWQGVVPGSFEPKAAPAPAPSFCPNGQCNKAEPIDRDQEEIQKWADAEAATYRTSCALEEPPPTFLFRNVPGILRSGYFSAPNLIVIYLRGMTGHRLCQKTLQHIIRHELLHWSDFCQGIPSPPNGKHEELFNKRIAAQWPDG